jgi:dihydroflavonol-4-reductase
VKVLVTGATGFLGRHLIPLLLERGDEVRALVRSSTDPADLERAGVDVVHGDVTAGAEAMKRAAAECGCIFNLAGVVSHEPKDLPFLRDVNVTGVENVLWGAEGSARLIHVSSVAAIGPSDAPTPVDETHDFPRWAQALPYAATKHAGEQKVRTAVRERGVDAVIVNPGFLLGPGDVYGVSTWHVKRYLQGTLRTHTLGGLSNVDARDIAAGLVASADRGEAGKRYILTSREGNLSHEAFFRRVATITGVRRRMVPIPRALARRAPVAPWPLKPGEVRAAAHWWFFDPGRAESELGFSTRPIDDTIADTAAQYL